MSPWTVFAAFVLVLLVLYVQIKVLTKCLKNRCIAGARWMEKLMVEEVYPKLHLSRLARKIQLEKPLCNWSEERQIKKAWQQTALVRRDVLPENEKESGYYARTGQFVCDVDRTVPLDRWYQPEDWVRDIVAEVVPNGVLSQQTTFRGETDVAPAKGEKQSNPS